MCKLSLGLIVDAVLASSVRLSVRHIFYTVNYCIWKSYFFYVGLGHDVVEIVQL